jgi:hypothetical protein
MKLEYGRDAVVVLMLIHFDGAIQDSLLVDDMVSNIEW